MGTTASISHFSEENGLLKENSQEWLEKARTEVKGKELGLHSRETSSGLARKPVYSKLDAEEADDPSVFDE
eukprot:CAMPEP_0177599094 /NCGR_PEP_ID=MMETSP0419_2-20121207/12777_1 /TAXON_ID=582737 /ORGANISM="Tetraselmis sp., Strain GSL018" /LENGTH=70 /DNA_ID=CAMNT_0019091739 /DNA_START=755 /DNA_END=964 /DNA_ORIENTATION=-